MATSVGFRVRTGRAIAVTVSAPAGPAGRPQVIDRRTVDLVPAELPWQVYHAAAGMPLAEADRLIGQVNEAANACAEAAIRRLLADLGEPVRVVGVGVRSADVPPRPLRAILASHTALHAAEGELYRDAVLGGAAQCGLDVLAVVEDDAAALAARSIGSDPAGVSTLVGELGKPLGPPWTKDQKLATLCALAALSP